MALLATARDLDGVALRAAIDRTFEYRATHPAPAAVPEPPETWAPVYARLASNDGLMWHTIREVTEAVQAFLDPVLAGRPVHWNAESWTWSNP